jgi:hypothetical protein
MGKKLRGLRAESEPVSACEEQDEQGETRLTRATKKTFFVAIAMFNEIKAVYPSRPSLTREGALAL